MSTPGSSQNSPAKISIAGPNLRPGDFCSPGIYVVNHREPTHKLPHEVLITTEMILPRCKECAEVRFSFKCAPPRRIEECKFLVVESSVLAARARSYAQEMRDCAERSRSLLTESMRFLAELERSVRCNEGIPAFRGGPIAT